ncbi:hypothetical protein SAMN06295998_109108 [Primorskyibacter flagellatus]|uniref:Uncharacterized protein n=1 Tax=Primorskyibacter flagellatus TaxID=1387277 RepID=A0A1W2CWU1_9RHOB|nr:hypothetical protein SAMN06295998_109108 [Primorskyibacter flagellatus]
MRVTPLQTRVLHMQGVTTYDAEYACVSPHVTRSFQANAIASLRWMPDQLSSMPRNPVATTNFSELSEREDGGLTFATLVKRCLSSF